MSFYTVKDVPSKLNFSIFYVRRGNKCTTSIRLSELQKVKAKARAKRDFREVANCCNSLGELFQQQGKYEDAIAEHEVCFSVLKNLKEFCVTMLL